MSLAVSFVVVIAAWWLSTGLILMATKRMVADGLALKLLAGAVAVIGLTTALASRDMPTQFGAWLGFSSGLMIWGVHEIAFLTGWIGGPRSVRNSVYGRA